MDDIFIADSSTSKSLLSFVSLFRSLIMFEICFVDTQSIVSWRDSRRIVAEEAMKNQIHGMMSACMREFAFHTCKSELIRPIEKRITISTMNMIKMIDAFLSTIEVNSSRYWSFANRAAGGWWRHSPLKNTKDWTRESASILINYKWSASLFQYHRSHEKVPLLKILLMIVNDGEKRQSSSEIPAANHYFCYIRETISMKRLDETIERLIKRTNPGTIRKSAITL